MVLGLSFVYSIPPILEKVGKMGKDGVKGNWVRKVEKRQRRKKIRGGWAPHRNFLGCLFPFWARRARGLFLLSPFLTHVLYSVLKRDIQF